MRFLLDTNAVIWATCHPPALTERVRQVIDNEQNEIFVSAASAWEIATKVRLGKLPEASELESNFPGWISRAGYKLLAIDTETALRAGRLRGEHKDPFDRIICAQALELDIPIISVDKKLDGFGVHRIW